MIQKVAEPIVPAPVTVPVPDFFYFSKFSKSLVLLLLILFSVGCSRQNAPSVSIIQPGSAQAVALALSAEDIAILHAHTPILLKKIDKIRNLSLEDVIKMHEVGITADSMILILEHTGTRLTLTTSDVIRLQTEGVPFKVINHMIRT